MIDYDSFSRCHLTDIFFRFSRGRKRVKYLQLSEFSLLCKPGSVPSKILVSA